ncbi:MAG: hypothetical protein ACT4PO_07710, partial [Actinomycetota bacterium]
IALALPGAIASDFARRYGPLFRGDLAEFGSQLYEQPLAFGLDALALGGLAAGAGKAVGQAAIKGTAAAGEATQLARKLLEAGVAPRTAQAAGVRGGLEALGAERPLSALVSLAQRTLPRATSTLVGDRFIPSATAYNPVTRGALGPIGRRLTEPLSALEGRVGALQGEISAAVEIGQKVPENLIAEYGLRSSLLKQAQELGLERIAKPAISDAMANLSSRRFFAKMNGQVLNNRLAAARRVQEEALPFFREAPDLEKVGADWMTGMNVRYGEESAQWFARQEARVGAPIETRNLAPAMVPTAAGGLIQGTPFRTALSDAGRAALEGGNPIATRTEAVVEKLRAYRARLEDPSDLVHQRIEEAAAEIDATDRLIDHLYAGLDRQILHDAPGPETIAAESRFTDRMRLLDMEKMVDEFDSLKSTPRQVLEETYVPLRLKYGAKWNEAGTALEGGPSVAELDDAFRAANEAAPTYFPFINLETMKGSDFFTSKQLVGANIYARDPHLRRMKGVLLMEGSYLRNPVEALTRRAIRGVRAQETFRQIMGATVTFGRPITKTADLPPGYVVIAPDLLFLRHRTGFHLEDKMDDLLSQGLDRDSAAAEALDSVTIKNIEDVARMVEAGDVKMWAVPKVVADRMTDAARAAGFVSGKGRLWYDNVMQAWRGLVLSGSPRWTVNNFLGNAVFGAMQGVKTADVIRSLGAHFTEQILKRESPFLTEIRRLPGFEDVPSGFVSSTIAQYEYVKPALASSKTYQTLQRAGQRRPITWAKRFGEENRRLNGIIEDAYRTASFLTAAERQVGIGAIRRTARPFMSAQRRIGDILERGFDENAARAALAEVTHFYGNYGALGPYERHVVRRFIFPFYGFFKHQAKLLLSFPFEYPGRAEVLRSLGETTRELTEEYGPMPEWLEGAMPFGPPGQGEIPFFTSRGPNPFNMSFSAMTEMLSPALKVILERSSGKNLFTGQPFSDPDVIRPYGTDQAFQIIRDAQGNPVDVVPLAGQPLPGFLEHLLQQVPQYEMAEEAIAQGKTYDTSTLLDALGGNAAIVDPATGQPKYPTGFPQQLLKLAGLGLTPYDLQRYQDRLLQLQKAALTQATNQGAY